MNKLSDELKRRYERSMPPKGAHWIDVALWPLAQQASQNKGLLLLNVGSIIGQKIRWRLKWIRSKGFKAKMGGREGSLCERVMLPASRRRELRQATDKDPQKGFAGKTRLQFTTVRAYAYALAEMEGEAGIPEEETRQFLDDVGLTASPGWFHYKFMLGETPWLKYCLVWALVSTIVQAGHELTMTYVYPLTSAKSP